MALPNSPRNIEDKIPTVETFGLNTAKPVDFTASPSVNLPANSTINNVLILPAGSLANIIAYAVAL